jgi:hypothetical protein
MRKASQKVAEKIKTHLLCLITFFFFENRAVCGIMWKNIVEQVRLRGQNGACALHAE